MEKSVESVHVVILAAGLGTRMKSSKSKVLHEAGGLPIVEHVIRAARQFTAAENITVVVGHQAERVEAAMSKHGVKFALQAEQKGTGHALLCAKEHRLTDGFTVVLYGDTPLLTAGTLSNLMQHHRKLKAAGTVMTTVVENPTGYGRIVVGNDGAVVAIVEQKAASAEQLQIQEINSGIYCFDTALLWPELEKLQPNKASGEVYLTDLIEAFTHQGKRFERFVLDDDRELLGINNRLELSQADTILRRRKVDELMLAGVTIELPNTVVIDPDVEVGADTVLGASTHLLGSTKIGANCEIGPSAYVADSEIGDQVKILPFTSVTQSKVLAEAHVGPFARLRTKNEVGVGAHVGNFVELKNAKLAAGVKAGHLTYLGDCTIGEATNIGAGSITCNYDGFAKHQTTIGSHVFVGSNSTLVAPLTLGDGSFTAAGSVITEDLAGGALGLGRARQTNKDGWADQYRAKRKK
jgi:bifunctional UDP-N-acetylglucosamine pyrophosphorylase / glucosamine-1-phosphate N-acetyltransferase